MLSWGVLFSEHRILGLYTKAFFTLSKIVRALDFTLRDRSLKHQMAKFIKQTDTAPVETDTMPANRKPIKRESLIPIVLQTWRIHGIPQGGQGIMERKLIAVYAHLLAKKVGPPPVKCSKSMAELNPFEIDNCAQGQHHFVTQPCGGDSDTEVAICISTGLSACRGGTGWA